MPLDTPAHIALLAAQAIGVIAILYMLHRKSREPAEPWPTASAPPAPPRLVLVVSASDTAGGYMQPPDAALHTVSPTPCVLIQRAAAQQCPARPLHLVDRCINGMRLREWLDGGVLQHGMLPGQPAGSIIVPPAAEWLPRALQCAQADMLPEDTASADASTPAPRPVVVLGLGMVDVLLDAPPLAEHLARVANAVALVRVAGAVPLLRGYHKIEPSAVLNADALARLTTADDALRLWARRNDVDYADMADETEYHGATDMAADGVHPTPDYHARLAGTLARALLRVRG